MNKGIPVMITGTAQVLSGMAAMMARITAIRTMAIARVRAAAAGPIPAAVVRAGRIARPMVTSGKQFI